MTEEIPTGKVESHVEGPRLIRALVILVWMLFLACYALLTENKPTVKSILAAAPLQSEPCATPGCSIKVRAEILSRLPGDDSHLFWACFKDGVVPRQNISENWVKQFDTGFDPDFAVQNYHTGVSTRWTSFLMVVNDKAPIVFLIWSIAMIIFIAFAIAYRSVWEYLSLAMTITIYLVIITHIMFTFVQGGLLVSPIGYVFGTIFVFLLANVKSALGDKINWRNALKVRTYKNLKLHEIFYVLMPLVLLTGSVAAHLAARRYFDEGTVFLLSKLFDVQYMRFFMAAALLGSISVITREPTSQPTTT